MTSQTRSQSAGSAVVSCSLPRRRLVAEVLYALLAASGVGVPAQQVLPKFSAVLTPHSLTSVLVGLSRKQAWAAAEATAVWARAASLELPAASYVRVAQRRAEGGHWEQAVQALGWMSDFACVPSGDTVHAVAELVNLGGARVDPARLRPFIAWLRGTEAGRALWHVYAPQLAAGEEGPAWRSTGLMTEQVDELLSGPLPDLKEALREIMPTEMAAGEVAEAPVLDTFEDIDDLLRARSAR